PLFLDFARFYLNIGIVLFQLLDPKIPPANLYSAAIVNLKGNKTVGGTYFLVLQAHHLFSVQPAGNLVSFGTDLHFIPALGIQLLIQFGVWLNKPSPAVRLIYSASIGTRRRHLHLPSADFRSFDVRPDEYSAVSVGFQLEFNFQHEILVF